MGNVWRSASSSEAEVFNARKNPCIPRGRRLAVAECDKPRDVDWAWKTVWMTFSVTASNSGWFSHVRALEGAHDSFSHRAIKDFVARLRAGVTAIDCINNNSCSTECLCNVLPSALKWTADTSSTTCNRQVYMAWSSDTLDYLRWCAINLENETSQKIGL
jgi:hypothetical protein